jgi:predicted RNase H-like nuclease
MLFIDAPLVVNNEPGTARLCERQVSQRYMHPWKVGANSTNPAFERLAGVNLLAMLTAAGWDYSDGAQGPERNGRTVSECYPYTTIVGTAELDYDERPLYKRKPPKMPVAEWRPIRAAACNELIRRVVALRTAIPPIDLLSHPTTAVLATESSPHEDALYKSREDLLDAALCAWTASIWATHGVDRCQVLGLGDERRRPLATIIAPARPEQRL